MSRGRWSTTEEHGGELNVVPFLDIITNVLMFVLATIAVTYTATIDASPPSRVERRAQPTAAKLGLTVVVLRDGFVVSAMGRRIGPGCEGPGDGLAVGRDTDGEYDFDGLTACAARLKALDPEFAQENDVTVTAAADVAYETVIHTLDALRSRGDESLFPKVSFAVPR
jgi:biopolymer transport protein ExbD